MNENKSHILIVYQFFYPENFRTNDIALELVKRGHKVTVLTGIPNYPEGKFYKGYGLFKKRRETWNGIDIIRIPLIPRGKTKMGLILNYLSFPVSGFFWNLFCSKKIKADQVYMTETSPMNQCKVGVQYGKKYNVPVTLYVQDLWPENVEIITGIKSPLLNKPLMRMTQKIFAGCDRIMGTSPAFERIIKERAEEAVKKYGFKGKKVQLDAAGKPMQGPIVSYFPQYAEDVYEPVPKRERQGFWIGFTGNIGDAQGLEVLPETAKILKKNNHNVHFMIVGNGRAKDRLLARIHELDVDDYFEFLPRVSPEKIPDILAGCDVGYISFMNHPFLANTIPAKLQSYMACGKAILALAGGETARIVEEADCGVCVRLENIVRSSDGEGTLSRDGEKAFELSKAIVELMSWSHQAIDEAGMRGYEYNKIHFDKKTLMDELEGYLN